MRAGFYKLQSLGDKVLLYAPSFVQTPNALLTLQDKDNYTYPVDGWAYYESDVAAYSANNIELPSDETLEIQIASGLTSQERLKWAHFSDLMDLPEKGGNGLFQIILETFPFGGAMFLLVSNFVKGIGTEDELRLLNAYVNMVFSQLSSEQKASAIAAIDSSGVPIVVLDE